MAREGFLDRWSRLKRDGEPEAGAGPEVDPALQTAPEADEPAAEDERTDDEILTALGLPHPDELRPGDDFRAFMAAAVPDRLRRMALRRLWASNPALANLDGLVEYGEDYTDKATVVENLQTLFRVGEGMVRKSAPPEEGEAAEDAAQDLAAEGEATTPDGAAPEETADDAAVADVTEADSDELAEADDDAPVEEAPAEVIAEVLEDRERVEAATAVETDDVGVAPTRRRMRFDVPTG